MIAPVSRLWPGAAFFFLLEAVQVFVATVESIRKSDLREAGLVQTSDNITQGTWCLSLSKVAKVLVNLVKKIVGK